MSDPIFSVPGLMEIQSPISDSIPPITRLPGYSRANSQWGGIDVVGPYREEGSEDPPAESAVRALMILSINSDLSCPSYVLDSEEDEIHGDITITDADDWSFSVPAQALPLRAGLWYWSFRVVDSAGATREIDAGRLMVRP